jgi:hypothetical protein
MTKLKLSAAPDDRPVKIAIELPAAVHRDLALYAEALARETSQAAVEPAKLIPPMIARPKASDAHSTGATSPQPITPRAFPTSPSSRQSLRRAWRLRAQ